MYALGGLATEERHAYAGHLGQCGFCRGLVSQFRAVIDLLPDALDERTGSAALKGSIITQARAEAAAGTRPPATPHLERRWARWLSSVPARAIALLFLVTIGLAAWNIALWVELKQQDSSLAEHRQLLSAVAAGGSIFSLAGTEAAPNASGMLVQDPAGGRSFLLLKSLPTLPADREYQIWRIKGNQPVGVGNFGLTNATEHLIVVWADFADADAIGVSIEPLGGSLAPTGAIVLLGTF
jgi:anti-sigma-K factor RskA